MAAQREIEKQRPASEQNDVVANEQSEAPKTRFTGDGKLPGVADKDKDASQARSASERAYNNDAKGAGVPNMTPVYVDQQMRWSLDLDEDTGKTYLSIPVHNKMIEYDEWYEIDKETFEKFKANPTLAHPMVEQARRREIDHLLLLKPGTDRGYPL